MRARQNLVTAILMTVVTTVLLGLVYPLVVTGLAQVLFKEQANGQLVRRNSQLVGSAIIGQGFTSPGYFHSRASAAGQGYDAASSGGTNLGPTNKKLIDSVQAAVSAVRRENPGACPEPCRGVPIDMVTTSASGFDPHITPDNAMFQVPRIARARGISEADLRQFVAERVEERQLGFLGEPRVNVLLLNLAMDERWRLPADAGSYASSANR
jgi:K+-transporting ATPase ATPase C chain